MLVGTQPLMLVPDVIFQLNFGWATVTVCKLKVIGDLAIQEQFIIRSPWSQNHKGM
jgi:hypothetical protein